MANYPSLNSVKSVLAFGMNLITTNKALLETCLALKNQPFIAVDTEFMRETTYWPKLCLIQVAAEGVEAIIDPLVEGLDLSPLLEIMRDEAILKLFHAPRQDLEIFFKLMKNNLPTPVFDSQTAAMALGLGEQVAYDGLVQALLGHNVDKTHRFTDWSIRPLSQNQLVYALADVTHLRDLYPIMVERLEKLGRLQWVIEEMEGLTNPLTYDTTPTNAWKRMKPKRFSAEYLAAFYTAATWREWFAQERDIPRGRALKDDAIFEIAEQKPRTAEALEKMRAIPRGFANSKGGIALLEALNEALDHPEEFAPKAQKPKHNPPGLGAIVELLKVLLRAVADELAVAPKLIATASDLEAIAANDDADCQIMHGWRREVFGNKALRLKHGEIALSIQKRQVVTTEIAENEVISHP